RMLTFYAAPRTAVPDQDADRDVRQVYLQLAQRLVAELPITGPPQIITMTAEARQWCDRVIRLAGAAAALPSSSPPLRGFRAKVETFFGRIALVFHLVDTLTDNRPLTSPLSAATAERAATLLGDFLLPHNAKFYGDLVDGQYTDYVRRLASLIVTRGLT